MIGRIFFLGFALFLSSCAQLQTFPLDTSKSVDIRESSLAPNLWQDGKIVDMFDALNHFETVSSEAQSEAALSRRFFWAGMLTSGVAGGFLGVAIADDKNNGQNYAVSAGFFVITGFLIHYQIEHLVNAANIYNRKFASTKRSNPLELGFTLGPTANGPAAAVQIRY